MNILYLNNNYVHVLLHRRMVEHLNEAGAKVSVYAPVYRYSGADVTTQGSQVVVSTCFEDRHRFGFKRKQAKIVADIKRHYDIKQFDCVHTNTLFVDGNCANELYKEYGIPFVTAVRDTDMHAYFKQAFWLRKKGIEILRNASAVFFLSETYRNKLIHTYVPKQYRQEIEKKSYLIPNGIDDFWLENRREESEWQQDLEETLQAIAQKKIDVIFPGAVCDRKNPLATQEALAILRKRGWKTGFTMVGKAKDQALLKRVLSYPDTTYLEPRPKEELITMYRKNSLLVMPSKTETFGLVYAEAMSQGLPVIYTKGQGFDTQFPEGEVGFHAAAEAPEEIADRIEQICASYEQIARRCVAHSDRFSWKDICAQYMEIYNNIKGNEVIDE